MCWRPKYALYNLRRQKLRVVQKEKRRRAKSHQCVQEEYQNISLLGELEKQIEVDIESHERALKQELHFQTLATVQIAFRAHFEGYQKLQQFLVELYFRLDPSPRVLDDHSPQRKHVVPLLLRAIAKCIVLAIGLTAPQKRR
jgi:hypothetical protein